MNAPTRLEATTTAFPLLWCPSCEEAVEPYQMTREDMADRGAIASITDALTGISLFRIHDRLVATDTPLCRGCCRVLA